MRSRTSKLLFTVPALGLILGMSLPVYGQSADCVAISETIAACALSAEWFAAPAPADGTSDAVMTFNHALTQALSTVTVLDTPAQGVAANYALFANNSTPMAEHDVRAASSLATQTFGVTSEIETRISPGVVTLISTETDTLLVRTFFTNIFQLPDLSVLSPEQSAAHAELIGALTEAPL